MAVLYRFWGAAVVVLVVVLLCDRGRAANDAFMDDLEEAMGEQSGDSKALPTDEELALYDRNGDGKLNHEEMAKYLKDALERVQNKGIYEEKQGKRTRYKPSSGYNIGKRELGIGLAVIVLAAVIIAVFIYGGSVNITSKNNQREVAVEDVRTARLRRLGVREEPITREDNNVSQSYSTGRQIRQRNVTRDLSNDKIKPPGNDYDTSCKPMEKAEASFTTSSNNGLKGSPSRGALSKESSKMLATSSTAEVDPQGRKSVEADKTANRGNLVRDVKQNTEVAKTVKEVQELKLDSQAHVNGKKIIREMPKVELSYGETVQLILPQILDCVLEIREVTTPQSRAMRLPLLSSSQPAKLDIKLAELPQRPEEVAKKIEKLLQKRICLELEPMKYAMKCHERCSLSPSADVKRTSNGAQSWTEVTAVIKDVCSNTVLKHLVHASTSPAAAEEDLWADFRNSGHSQGPSHYFLACLSGWSSDGVSVSVDFLSELLEKGNGDPQVRDTFLEMVISAGKYANGIKRMDEIAMECGRIFKGLETLIKQPRMVQFLTEVLEKEAARSLKELGTFFQKNSIFSTFLSLTTIEAKITGKSRASEPFKQLPHFPQLFQSDIDRIQSQIQDGIHSCQNVVHKVLRRVLSRNQESALAWLAAVVTMNGMRTALLDSDKYEDIVAGDGYMMNVCTVLLQLCEPFFVTKGADKMIDIQNTYPVSKACRLEYSDERTIAGLHLGEDGDEKEPRRDFTLTEDLRGQFNLKSEVFHITHRALHIGLTNTIQHYNRLLRNYMILKEMNEGKESAANFDALLVLFVSQWDTVIQDHQFMRLGSQFYITTAAWIVKKLESCISSDDKELSDQEVHERQREVLSTIPEFYIKDMCTWFHYVVVHNPHALKGLDVYTFVDCSATLMNNKGCLPGPMVASKIVTVLLAFAECCSKKKKQDNLLETASWGSGIEGDLTACVVTCQKIKKKLVSALIHTYTSVDVVEGLDVDKEEFDKFSSRAEIVKLLQFLWTDVDHRDSLKSECGKDTFQGFLSAILDSLLYLLSDGLSRVINVGKLQKSREDHEKWEELDFQEQQEKAQFLKNEEHVSKSFMKMATATLAFLAMITEEKTVARCFSRPPISQRAASAIIGFLDSLCGPRSLDLKVKNMEKYSFNPRELLVKLVTVLLNISQAGQDENEAEFLRTMAADPDYSRRNIEQALRILKREGLAADDTLRALRSFLAQCENQRRLEFGETSVETSSETSQDVPEQEGALEGEGKEGDGTEEETEGAYIEALKDARYDTTELLDHTAFQCCRSQPVCQRSATVRTLMREITQLKDNLPIHPNSSVFVRQDEDRMDFVRAMITGPVDTPYSRGCFVFDVYFPGTYPNVPPLVKLITTGNGTVRFNPNLYADGKVCLSLLGTWHGGDASEKWDSKKSSLYQVLLSIQGMILIPDPCFNEPGYEGIRGTAEGDTLSREYNAGIRLATVRHAMVGQLRQPPAGLEDLIRTHFRLQREAILRQCSDWLQQCCGAEEERRMRRAVEDLKAELDKL